MPQHLEKYISKTLRTFDHLWFQKNQIMPLAHKQSVGDFLVLTENANYVIECKECKNLDGKGVFSLDRLTQLNDLIVFQNKLQRNKALIAILFWNKTLKNSSLYIIPLSIYREKLLNWGKKSLNIADMAVLFKENQLKSIEELGQICK